MVGNKRIEFWVFIYEWAKEKRETYEQGGLANKTSVFSCTKYMKNQIWGKTHVIKGNGKNGTYLKWSWSLTSERIDFKYAFNLKIFQN